MIPEPLASGLVYPNRSLMAPVPAGSYQLVATGEGDPSDERLCEPVTLSERGVYELVIAQPEGSSDPSLIEVGRVR